MSMESDLTPATVLQVSQVTDVRKAKVGSVWFKYIFKQNKKKKQCPVAFQVA